MIIDRKDNKIQVIYSPQHTCVENKTNKTTKQQQKKEEEVSLPATVFDIMVIIKEPFK